MIWLLLIFVMLMILAAIWYYPKLILNPINSIYRTDRSERKLFYTDAEKREIFPVSLDLENNWLSIRTEGQNLFISLENKNINYLNSYHIDIGDENKQDWTTIPLRLFTYDCPSYMSKCPKLTKILKSHPEIVSCLFSIMQPGKIIKPHRGPYDGLIRYQLALTIPKDQNGDVDERCHLYVGDKVYRWEEGNGVMFDESNIHGAVNNTDQLRMVLLIDLKRPYTSKFLGYLNSLFVPLMGIVSPRSL